ncbi:MAG TPA: hypothetical protein VEK37_11415 [Gemmatimonadaceae bacterium]|nr:hypothetical protein [Gemmatimonadaceae bacterium]
MLIHAFLLILQATSNTELGYVMSLPDDFVAIPAEFAGGRDVVGCWAGEGSQSSRGAFVLCVQRMHATLGREHLKSTDLPAKSQLLTVRWKGLDIDAIRTDTGQTGTSITVYTAQVPLRREAIQVIVAGPSARATEALAILNSVLGSLKGETNWLSSTERAGRMGTIVGWVIGIAIGVLIVRMVLTRRRAQSSA